ncbi:hypothetical protein INR49_010744 [Caranx melampygus]|nr:hypothetical protein INR49_010744 [Caranx melampygus]
MEIRVRDEGDDEDDSADEDVTAPRVQPKVEHSPATAPLKAGRTFTRTQIYGDKQHQVHRVPLRTSSFDNTLTPYQLNSSS